MGADNPLIREYLRGAPRKRVEEMVAELYEIVRLLAERDGDDPLVQEAVGAVVSIERQAQGR